MRARLVAIALLLGGCATAHVTPTRPTPVVRQHHNEAAGDAETDERSDGTVVQPEPIVAPPVDAHDDSHDRENPEHPSIGTGDITHGDATWYGGKLDGGATASGERFDSHAFTAAHRTIKLGTWVRVTNEANGKSVDVRINDRGPFGRRRKRIIDISEAAARKIGIIDAGVGHVSVEILR